MMRTLLVAAVCAICTLGRLEAQSADSDFVGTWVASAGCLHGDGETLTLTLARDRDGILRGSTDWARSSSDGRSGPQEPLTTLSVKGADISATTTTKGRTIRLVATVDGDTITGSWAIDGDSDKWTFAGKRQRTPAGGTVPR